MLECPDLSTMGHQSFKVVERPGRILQLLQVSHLKVVVKIKVTFPFLFNSDSNRKLTTAKRPLATINCT